jgi:predicted aspartyl protease
MTGTVTSQLKGIITVEVRAPDGHQETLPFLLDTGFDGFLALPPQQIAGLRLPLHGTELVLFADGREAILPVYRAFGVRS